MLSLAYATEVPSEISAERSHQSDSFFGRLVGLVTSFFSWSIATFGNGLGKVLGWLGVGTPLLFLLWVIKKIVSFFVNRYIISPVKRAINKHSVDKYGTNVFKNEVVEYKRRLTKQDIVRITKKYGASEKQGETHDFQEVYTLWQYGVMTWYFVYFCEDGIHAQKGLFSPQNDYMDYDTLREDDTTIARLKRWFDDYPHEFYTMLMELKEA